MASSEEQKLSKVSKDIVNQLAGIIRMSQIHDTSNVAVVSGIEKLAALVNSFTSGGQEITLELVGEDFYLNGSRIKYSMEYLANFDYLMHEFGKRLLGSLTFYGELTKDDASSFLKAFMACGVSSDPFIELSDAVSVLNSLSVGVPKKIKEKDQEYDPKKLVKKTYFNAVSFTQGVMKKIQSGEKVNVKRAKRVVQSMVDMLLTDDELMLGMTSIKDYDDYTYHHSVNVSILSIALGQKLGFSKQALLDLGMVALFHDIGKVEVPTEVLNKPSSFTEDEWMIMKKHSVWGVRAILTMKGFDLLSIRAAIVAFEHHISMDNKGYPERQIHEETDLYSRIVSLADQYDGMTSSRVYFRTPMSPEKALSLMMERSGVQLDPLLFKFFVNMVGNYPVGTGVMLDTRELGIVYGNNMAFPDRPRVMVITDNQGNKCEGSVVDLAEKSDGGDYKRSINKVMDPHKFKINLAEYLL
jgi:HD-GYP domain-containing protein (c-di-GMP phosphodiesterase class II)